MKTNVGQNPVRSSRGDETSRVKKDVEKTGHKKVPCLYIPKNFGNKARNGSFGDDLCPNRGSPSIDAKTLLLMEIASASTRMDCK